MQCSKCGLTKNYACVSFCQHYRLEDTSPTQLIRTLCQGQNRDTPQRPMLSKTCNRKRDGDASKVRGEQTTETRGTAGQQSARQACTHEEVRPGSVPREAWQRNNLFRLPTSSGLHPNEVQLRAHLWTLFRQPQLRSMSKVRLKGTR